jgi:hypothetical protein
MYECSTFVCSVWCMVCQSMSACRTMSAVLWMAVPSYAVYGVWCVRVGVHVGLCMSACMYECSTFVCSVWCMVCQSMSAVYVGL